MKLVIDNFDSSAGWSGSGAVSIHGENEHEDYIAGDLSRSLIFHFPAGSRDAYIEKTLAPVLNVSAYQEIIVSLWSIRKNGSFYRTAADFPYTLDFGTGKQYGIPAWPTFTQISLDISSLASLERIRIIAAHDDEDYLVMSYMIAAADEIPRDIFEAFKEGIERVRVETWPAGGPLVATLTAALNDTTITFAGARDWLQEGAVVKVSDGVNTETHQLGEGARGTFKLSSLYDGKKILHAYSSAPVYLQYQIEFGRLALEAIFPGIGIWGFVPTPMQHTPVRDETIKSYCNGQFQFKRGGLSSSWRIVIDVAARDPENLADMTAFVRRYLSRCVVWCNGRDFDISLQEPPVDEEQNEAVGILPNMHYLIDIEIVEDVNATVHRARVLTDKLGFNIENNI